MADSVAQMKETQMKVGKGQLFIEGKIDTVEEYKGDYTTRVVLPAIDSYSSPDVIIIRSKVKVGLPDEILKGVFQLRGFKHFYDTQDGKRVNTANMYLSPVQEF